jgi:hypothetical protein
LEDLKSKEVEFGVTLDSSMDEMNTELAELDKKYPNGQIDSDTGTIIY